MVQLQKSRLQLGLSFGRHATKGDAQLFQSQVAAFKPHIYIKESPDLLNEQKQATLLQINKDYEKARADLSFRRALMDKIKAKADGFGFEVTNIILDTYRLGVYAVETYSPEERKHLEIVHPETSRRNCFVALQLLHKGNLAQALRNYEIYFREWNYVTLTFRDVRIVEGFHIMLDDLVDYFPRLAAAPSIRIFARFGTAHAGIADTLAEDGFNISFVNSFINSEELTPQSELLLKLGKDPKAQITADELLAVIFADLTTACFPPDARRINTVFERVGKQQGFLGMIRSLSSRNRDFNLFRELLFERIKNAAEPL